MSKICAFLGNATIWNTREVMKKIKLTAIDLIKNKGVDIFLVGTKGNFENLAHKMMEQIQCDYPDIKIMLVIAYAQDLERCPYNFDDIYYPPKSELGYTIQLCIHILLIKHVNLTILSLMGNMP